MLIHVIEYAFTVESGTITIISYPYKLIEKKKLQSMEVISVRARTHLFPHNKSNFLLLFTGKKKKKKWTMTWFIGALRLWLIESLTYVINNEI